MTSAWVARSPVTAARARVGGSEREANAAGRWEAIKGALPVWWRTTGDEWMLGSDVVTPEIPGAARGGTG
jgi:hypothetical protein